MSAVLIVFLKCWAFLASFGFLSGLFYRLAERHFLQAGKREPVTLPDQPSAEQERRRLQVQRAKQMPRDAPKVARARPRPAVQPFDIALGVGIGVILGNALASRQQSRKAPAPRARALPAPDDSAPPETSFVMQDGTRADGVHDLVARMQNGQMPRGMGM